MSIDLIPWVVLWAAVTTGVLGLFVWRMLVARTERGGIYIVPGEEPELEHQVQIAKTLARIDFWGKTLTVAAALLVIVIGSLWVYNVWQAYDRVARGW